MIRRLHRPGEAVPGATAGWAGSRRGSPWMAVGDMAGVMRGLLVVMLVCFAIADRLVAEEALTPGVALAEGITEITGVAISPLLGVSAVGSWTYFRTEPERRAELAWYCQPWAWGSGFVILGLCFLKDSLGAAAPGVLKKPLDMAELFENKLSALVASVGFVPLVALELTRAAGSAEVPTGAIGAVWVAVIDPSWITVPLAVLAFAVVWVCSHAVNVLIILSPFSSLDTLLKLGRTAMLSAVALSYLISPWLGAALSVLILGISLWLAPSAMRLMIFGSRFALDVLLPGRGRRRVDPDRPHVFTLGRLAGLPPRTGGRLVRTEVGEIEFRYRPWCLLPERRVALPVLRREMAKGLLSPSLVTLEEERITKVLVFLPRYRGQEAVVVEKLGFHGVRDHPLARGWGAVKGWWREMFRRRIEG